MLHYEEIKQIAIGKFDGMHIGHKKIFDQLEPSCSAIIVIDIGFCNITPHYYKQKLIDIPIIFISLEDIKNLSADDFINNFLKDMFINLEKIVVGYDFAFGKDRVANTDTLKNIFQKEVVIIEEVTKNGISVHSKEIRKFIQNSDIKLANTLLGYNYRIIGKKVNGQGLGKEKLLATINIDVDDFLIPSYGVYATNTIIKDIKHKSISFIGNRLSTDKKFSIETHLLNQTYFCHANEIVQIEFIDKIRDNIKFETLDDLKSQMQKDLIIANNINI
jgi:riboflavin kinase/FMN adenylyltransferase